MNLKPILPISIVIPALNEEKFLPHLMESIKMQQFQPQEVIVAVSPKTTDKTAKIARSYGAKVVEGGIPGESRNNGAKYAKGDLILFLDGDAIFSYEYFLGELYILFMKENLDISSCLLDLYTTGKENFLKTIPSILAFKAWNQAKRLHEVTKQVLVDSGTGIFVKKDVFEKLGGFKQDKEFVGEDTEFSKRAVEKGYKYKVLPLRIMSSGRRYDTPSKATRAYIGNVMAALVIALGLYNSDKIIKFVVDLYGKLGGEPGKEKKPRETK